MAGPLLAQPVMVDSAAGTAGRAAIAIARQTRTSIVIADAPIASRRVPPIRGHMEPEEAARRLAQAAGGRAVRAGSAGWRIVALSTASPAPPASPRRERPAVRSVPPPPPVQPLEPAEIVVSASKQDAMLSQFAGQVSFIEGEDIERGGIGGTERISERIATVSSTHLGSGRNKLFIRGIADSSFTGPTQATVGQYLGDLRLSYNAPDPDLRLSDLERVEVLEGPQGTLYGAGSLGGIIRLVPNAPELGIVAGSAQIGGSLTQHGAGGVDASAMANLPLLGEGAALRMTLDAATQGGYIDKPLLDMENVNRTNILGGRAMVRVELAPDWTVDLIGVAQTIEADDSQYADRDGVPLVQSSQVVEGSKADYRQGQFVVSGWLGDIRLRSTTGVASQDLRERYDATLPEGEPRVFVQTNNTEMFANETRIWQPLGDRIGWLAGFSFTHNTTRLTRSLEGETGLQTTTGVSNTVDEAALYGEVRLALREGLIASVGGRLTHSRLGGAAEDVSAFLSARLGEATASRSETAFLPSASLLARLGPSDSLFVRYQESFRPGGLAIEGPFVRRFANDRTATFELGARHGQSGSGGFDLAASLSYTRWTDIQADFIDSAGFPSTANIGDGHVWSASVSGGVELAPGLRAEGGVVFNDSEIDSSDLVQLLRMTALPALSGDYPEADNAPQIAALNELTQVPNIARFAGRIGFDYRRPIGARLELSARGWASYVGKSRLGVGPELGDLQGDYLDSGATVRIGSASRGLTLSVTNLADVEGNRFALGTPFAVGREQVTPLRPRTIRLGFDAASDFFAKGAKASADRLRLPRHMHLGGLSYMRNFLFASTAAIALAAPLVSPAMAEDIGTARTTPARTSTIANGAPAAIKITDKGSITLTSGTAVTMDSNHAVTNEGTIKIADANGAAGIVAVAGTNGAIVNSGTITIDEPYTPTDTDKDGDLDGPFALGSNRFGIRIDGAHTGKVENSGKITVEGNDSAGIWIAGPLDGAFTHNGTTAVLGNGSTAIRLDAITGDVRLAGTVTAQGQDAVGVRFTDDVTGAMVVQGNISATGYRYPTAPSSTAKLDADDLLQGGSALVIEGDVTGGIVLAVAPKDTDKNNADEDADGIPDADEGSANVIGYGAAPAMVIGATGRDIAIGPVGSTASKFGLQIDGVVRGAGVYAGVDANGLQIGGRGGAVAIANGVSVAGSVTAVSVGANATALRFGAGATTPVLQVSGTVQATGADAANEFATAVRVDQGASLPVLRNSGTIKAVSSGANGNATAIVDASGTLALIENSGKIEASGAKSDSTRNIAIDLSANTSGATVRQTVVGSGFAAPGIVGDIRFGSGNDVLDLADGTMTGSVYFGAGTGQMTLSGDASYKGNVYFGGGADVLALSGSSVFTGLADFGGGADTMTLAGTSRFSGTLANAGNLAVSVTGGTLDLTAPVSIASLDMSKDGRLIATLDKAAGQGSLYNISGTASIAKGATLELRLANLDDAEGRYEVLKAGTLQGGSDLALGDTLIPFLFKATLATDAAPNTIAVDIARRSEQELGLNRAQASAFDAVFAALGKDEDIEDFFMGITNGDNFRAALGQLLPEHSGGAFEGISMGTRILARQAAESVGPTYSLGGIDLIFNVAVWTSSKDAMNTASYDVDGMAYSVAGELDTEKLGTVGVSAAYFYTTFDQGSDLSRAQSDTIELAAYWRGKWGGLSTFARGSYGFADFGGTRTLQIGSGTTGKKLESRGDWGGNVTTLSGGASYETGGSLFVRPAVWADFVKLSEDGYTEKGGGKGMDLIVEQRDSDEFAVNGSVAVGIDFYGKGPRDSNWLRVEGEGGWREIVGGSLGATTARFEGGESFTIAPDEQTSGWFARARAVGGSDVFEFGGEVGAEERFDKTAFSLKGTLRIGL